MGEVNDIKQGDIVVLNFNPTRGREQNGIRPALVVSGNAFHFSKNLIVCPLTTKIKNLPGGFIVESSDKTGLKQDSEVLVGQIRTMSFERVVEKLGESGGEQIDKFFKGIDMIFDRRNK